MSPHVPRLRPVALLLQVPIRLYRLIPRFGPPRCKFYPSCSSYALEALGTHGALQGAWLAIRRLLRCHPYTLGGMDPVPPVPRRRKDMSRA